MNRVEVGTEWEAKDEFPATLMVAGQKLMGPAKPGRYVCIRRQPQHWSRTAITLQLQDGSERSATTGTYAYTTERKVLTHCKYLGVHHWS